MTEKIQASISTRANVYFGGKCVSHGIELADGTKKSVGVILPAALTFNTGAPEVMELVDGECRIKLAGSSDWTAYRGGESFQVPGKAGDALTRKYLLDARERPFVTQHRERVG